jgi:hypothetical protein
MRVVLGDGDSRNQHCIFKSPSGQARIIVHLRCLSTLSSFNTLTTRRANARYPNGALLSNIQPHQSYEPMSITHGIWNGRTHGHYNSFRKLQVPDCEHLFTIIKATRSPYLRSNYRHLTCLEISCETSPGRRTRNGCRGWVHENMVTQAPQAVHFRVPASPNLLFDLSTNVRWAGIFWALRDFSAGRYHHDERKQSAADSNHCSCQS